MVTIVIPTKNAETYLEETLHSVFEQETVFDFEILLIDSGSKDKTRDLIADFPVRLVTISPETFNHGETRNLGVREANPESEFIVFLSQDAKPKDNQWLRNLIKPFQGDSKVAGVYSRHIPRSDASASVVRQIILGPTGRKIRSVKKMPESLEEYEANKIFYITFSNTSSAIRRKVWEEIQFDRVDFAEDALWADKVLRAGYTIVFDPSSAIIHSHNYNPVEQFRQNVDHAYAMNRLFKPQFYRRKYTWFRHFIGIPIYVWKDCIFAMTNPFFADKSLLFKIKSMAFSLPWQIATISGAFVGAHLEDMHPRMRLLLSRQERIRLL